jgi:hypothetical protein
MLGEGLDAAEAFVFHGFGGVEFAVDVGFGARATGMERTTLAGNGATGWTGYGRKLGWGEVFHTHFGRMRHVAWECCSVWNSLAKKVMSGREVIEKRFLAKATAGRQP